MPHLEEMSVATATADGSAIREIDYLEISGTLNFVAGETQKQLLFTQLMTEFMRLTKLYPRIN